MQNKYMQRAISLAKENMKTGGGPFGAVIVRNGEIVAEAANHVTKNNDPTAHAEVEAIRLAGENLKNYDLADCEIYASCEPCPMCLGAIYWARIPVVYYAADRKDAEGAGFDDSKIYNELAKNIEERELKMIHLNDAAAKDVFNQWNNSPDKTPY